MSLSLNEWTKQEKTMEPQEKDADSTGTEEKEKEQKTEKSQLVLDEAATEESLLCCGISKPLLFIKAFYFFFIGALGSVAPFISILFKQYGLSPQQIGLIFGLRPIIGFISGPLWGVIADKFNMRRILLLMSLTFWISVFVTLAFVPAPARVETCPAELAPHRENIELRGFPRHRLLHQPVINENFTANLTEEDLLLLREDYGWIYDSYELHKVFIIFMLLVLLGEFTQSPTTALSDAATLQLLGTSRLNAYGNQRAWGSLGWAMTAVSVGALVSSTRVTETICQVPLSFSNYFGYVYVFGTFMFLAFICAALIPFPEKIAKGEKVEEDKTGDEAYSPVHVFKVFLSVHYGSWIITAFFVGVFNGMIWGFLNWHLDNLGADELLIGLSNVLKCVCEFIMYFFVHRVSDRIGHMGLMYVCLSSYAVLFLGYGMLANPWWVLLLEVLHGLSFSCVWVSLTAYSTLAVPSSSLATIQGVLHGVYFGLGNGTGNLSGGLLIGEFGVPITYFAMSVCAVITAVFLFTAQKCSTKPQSPYQKFDN